ncbi:MAG: FtsX-like permease family protein [Bacteroidota bacterium]
MNIPFFIARRYFLSKKKRNFINVISIISMFAVGFGAMALIVALSVFNGLEGMLRSLHEAFDPNLKVLPLEGKSFEWDMSLTRKIESIEGIEVVTPVIEDNAYVKYKEAQMVVKLKGVADNFNEHGNISDNIVQGEFLLKDNDISYAVLGRGVQYSLSLSPSDDFNTLQFFYPKRGRNPISADPSKLTNRKSILASGIFAIIKEYDEKYVIVPIDFAKELMGYENKITALEIKVLDGYSISKTKEEVKNKVGSDFRVLNEDEQHASILKALKIEKLFVFLTFSFIIAIAAFNIFFSLTMLGIEKKKDIAVLYSMGAPEKLIKSIFLAEGALIALSGAITGLLLGFLFVWSQENFGIISMGMSTSVVEAYPVEMQAMDFILVGLAITTITFMASYQPALIAKKVDVKNEL